MCNYEETRTKMKNLIILTFVIFLAGKKTQAQHCPYDFASIIVVSIHEKDSSKNIPNLKLTLVDSSGNAVLDRNEKEIVFWQNPEKTTFEGYIDNNNPAQNEKIRFPFAKDNYVWVCSIYFSLDDYYLKIEKIGDIPQYRLPDYKLIKLYEVDKFHLCDSYKNEDYHKDFGSRRLYKPIEIIIDKI